MFRRVLIIKLRHIGDVLLGTAVASALKAAVPDCQVTYLVPSGTEELLSLCPDVDSVLAVPRGWGQAGGPGRYLAAQGRILRALRRGGFELALDLTGGDRSAFLAWASGAPWRVGVAAAHAVGGPRTRLYTEVVTQDAKAHTVQQDLDVLRAAGLPTETAPVRVHTPPELAGRAAERLRAAGIPGGRPLVVVHPTSRWLFKTWPEAKVAACLTRLAREGLAVALTCGPEREERDRFARIVEGIREPIVQFPGTLRLIELAAILASAQAFLGVDSAPAHLAAALGVPSVVLFGPTGAYNWGPWVPTPARTPYPATAGSQAAGPHVVLQQPWLCAGCGMAGCLGSKQSDCLEALSVDAVCGAVMARLGRGAMAGAAR